MVDDFKKYYKGSLRDPIADKQKSFEIFEELIKEKGLDFFKKLDIEYINGYFYGGFGYMIPENILEGYKKWFLSWRKFK